MKYKLLAVSLFSLLSLQTIQAEETLPSPKNVVLAEKQTLNEKASEILAALRYAAFWNTGEERYVREALDSNFMDRTLPDGRPQGIEGPLQASKMFRGAVPDLNVSVEKMIVANDHVVLHLNFEGHFTGTFNGIKGKGQKISFIATDIYKIKNGKITDNWHIEDNLKLLQQMEIIKL